VGVFGAGTVVSTLPLPLDWMIRPEPLLVQVKNPAPFGQRIGFDLA